MGIDIEWDKILERFIQAALPIVIAALIAMIKSWLEGASKEDIVAAVDKVGKTIKEGEAT